MFSITPNTGTLTLRNMLRPLRASESAMSWGVETIMAPVSGTCCDMVSCTSPVPGGISTTSTSKWPQLMSRIICISADCAIGPRQMIGVSSSTSRPMDMHLMPWFSNGSRVRPSLDDGSPDSPSMRGMLGP